MPNALAATLQDIASRFAHEIVQAIRAASIADIRTETEASIPKRGAGRPRKLAASPARGRTRRGAEELEAQVGLIVKFVKSHPGSSSETIRKELGIAKNDWLRPIGMALASKALKKKGEKRSTKYWAA